MQNNDSFRIILFKDDWFSRKLGYESTKALTILKTLDTTNNLFVISLNEIERYNWDKQTITLTEDATSALAQSLEGAGELTEGAEKLKSLKKSLGWGNPLQSALYTRIFLVELNGKFLYGGIFLDAVSQMAINYPVARIMLDDGKAVIALIPIHIPFVNEDPVDGTGNIRGLDITDEARGDIESLNQKDSFADNWIRGVATSPAAVEHRRMLRNPKIKEILKASGKIDK